MGRMSERRQAEGSRSDGRDDQLTVWLLRALLYRNHWVTLTGGRGWGHEELFQVVGLDPDAREAVAFAALAWAHLRGIPANVPASTGAAGPRILGSLTPGAGQ